MEYNREEKKKKGRKIKKKGGRKTKMLQTTSVVVAPIDESLVLDEIKTGKFCFKCGIPSLKTLGEFFFFNSE